MKTPLVISASLMIVLLIGTMFTRPKSWRVAHVWLIAIGSGVIGVYFIVRAEAIPEAWQAILTVALLCKNLSLMALLAELNRTAGKAKVLANGNGSSANSLAIAVGAVGRGGSGIIRPVVPKTSRNSS